VAGAHEGGAQQRAALLSGESQVALARTSRRLVCSLSSLAAPLGQDDFPCKSARPSLRTLRACAKCARSSASLRGSRVVASTSQCSWRPAGVSGSVVVTNRSSCGDAARAGTATPSSATSAVAASSAESAFSKGKLIYLGHIRLLRSARAVRVSLQAQVLHHIARRACSRSSSTMSFRFAASVKGQRHPTLDRVRAEPPARKRAGREHQCKRDSAHPAPSERAAR
jgi:hypothetical protein